MKNKAKILKEIYERLLNHFGPQNWWPAQSPFEICIGAILTQNTNWKNVEKALKNLNKHSLLDPFKLYSLELKDLSQLIKPSGFYNLKAKRLKNFIKFLIEEYNGNLETMFSEKLEVLRNKLLSIKGLGKETVDSILLYAGNFPLFVVDTYTYRILSRHQLVPEEVSYDEIQALFMENLPAEVKLYQEYHALLVACGKSFCKNQRPNCSQCPLTFLFMDL
ncbi:MAG: endonuclease III domain-containing protein [Thermodesulfobacteriaceae bacterium]|nr:endonuclease III domain-containing protein [Thermodesulfobacteriaceae bacterium]